jgi:hypothetical protein
MVKVETKDLYCGAYFLSSGAALTDVRVEGRRNGKPAVVDSRAILSTIPA